MSASTLSASLDRPAWRPAEPVGAAHWGGVFAMTLCVFALIASEFMPVSLLTPIASALQVSEGLAGQGIAISGAFAVLTSLLISRVSRRVDRRTLLLSLTALMGVSGAIVGAAHGYLAYMAGRALIGVVVGGFWSMSAATAMQLVPAAQVPRALAMFNGSIGPVDCVIVDLNMKPMNGLEFLKAVRTGVGKWIPRDQRVVMLTGHGELDAVRCAVEFDINGYILKPVSTEKLVTTLDRAMSAPSVLKDAEDYRMIMLPDVGAIAAGGCVSR